MAAGGKLKLGQKNGMHSGPTSHLPSQPANSSEGPEPGPAMSSAPPPLHTSLNGIHEIHPPQYALDLDSFPGRLPPPPLTGVVPIHRRRRSTKNTMPLVKRSASTPNVRGQAAADAASMSMSAADKRRNKLGYHRTSVACGHCRRRKIRCLLAPDDPQGRCSNCIRLKKECNFFPVDQQPPTDRRPRTSSKPDRASGHGSDSSSPSPTHPGAIQDFNDFHQLPITPSQSGYSMSNAQQRNQSMPAIGKPVPSDLPSGRSHHLPHMPPSATGSYDFSQGDRSATWAESPYVHSPVSAGPKSGFGDPSTTYWRDSPVTPAFTSFAHPPPMPAVHRESDGSFYNVPREEPGWPVVSRSMSYGQVEGIPVNYQNHYPPHHDYKQPPHSAMYPPSLNTSDTSMASISEPSSAPADGRPGTFGMAPPWNPNFMSNTLTGMTGKGSEGLGGWYQETSHLAQVEEEGPGPLNEDPSMFFQPNAQSAA
ncbi:MAG: hypothetical protein M1833_006258 [Piccolia ochrophora]|nr:MAG: hypothetical protein M1833_006258 [Piccolia ochrophora]